MLMKPLQTIMMTSLLAATALMAACNSSSESSFEDWSDKTYELVWADEFDGPDIDTSVWKYETKATGWSQSWNNEWQNYVDCGTGNDYAYIEEGVLVMKAVMTGAVHGGDAYQAARMVTKGTRSWQYGRIEASMALPYGKGIWPAFWMLGNNGAWPASGEIDIMEQIGGGRGGNTVYGKLNWANAGNVHASTGTSRVISDPTGFHTYTLDWTPRQIRVGVDGDYFYTQSIMNSDMSEFHQPFYLILNLAVGGNWPGYPDSSTVFPQVFKIDWIRVYQPVD
jgi:beta-glucanase (GH16 family)